MSRYYDTENKAEVFEKFDDITLPSVTELPDDHIFWQPLPVGKQFTYDSQGIPDGYEDKPVIPMTPYQEAELELRAGGVNKDSLLAATVLAQTDEGKQIGKDRIQAMEQEIETVAATYSLTFDNLVTYLFTGEET